MCGLKDEMKGILNSDNVFSDKAFIHFSQYKWVPHIIIFQDMAAYLFIRKYKEAKENVTEETERIINAAANLIKA